MRQAGRYLPEYRAIRGNIALPGPVQEAGPRRRGHGPAASRRLGVDAAIIFSDILIPVEAHGDGAGARGQGPALPEPGAHRGGHRALARARPGRGHAASWPRPSAARARRCNDSVPVIGFAGAPFTLAAYMVEGGGSKSYILIKRLLFEQPKLAHTLFEKLTRHAHPLPARCRSRRARGRADLRLVGRRARARATSRRFSLPYLTRMVKELQATGVPVILFGTAMSTHLPLLKRTGADVIGLDWRIELDEAAARARADVAVQGNLDPLALFLPREELEARVVDILHRAGPVGHIFNLGHGILPPTDPEAAKFMVEAVTRLRAPSGRVGLTPSVRGVSGRGVEGRESGHDGRGQERRLPARCSRSGMRSC